MEPLPPLPPPGSFMPQGGGAASPATPTAQSVPISGPLPEIPPPHMAAPYVYYRPPMQRPQPQYPPMQQQMQMPQPPVQQPPPQPQPPQQPPQQPPAQQQQQQPQGPTAPLPGVGLDDATIIKLNERLNSESDSIRSDAAIDFFKIVEKNPGLADNPTYKPYVDAFVEKILNDPSPVVRQGALLALELGYVKNPSANTRTRLDVLGKQGSAYGVEGGAIQNIMQKLSTQFAGTPGASPDAASPQPSGGQAPAGTLPGGDPTSTAANPGTDPLAALTGAGPNPAGQAGVQPSGGSEQDFMAALSGAGGGGDLSLPATPNGNAGAGGLDNMEALMAALSADGMGGSGNPAAPLAGVAGNAPVQPPGQRLNLLSRQPAGAHNSGIAGFNANGGGQGGPGQKLNLVQGG